ncbi:DUF2637 domain-containing protein [Streptomyces asoensis]|uniref:DUF2637 domain-containing protein n=1 Tax=Streptomyces asoensis TaxID=249586 RepID=UPI0033EC11B4
MSHDYVNPSFVEPEWRSDTYSAEAGQGWAAEPDDRVYAGVPLTAPDAGWDPVEELALLLQEPVPAEEPATVAPSRSEPPSGVVLTDPVESPPRVSPRPPSVPGSSSGHRRSRTPGARRKWLQVGSLGLLAVVAVVVAMVSVLGGMAAYRPLQNITSGTGVGAVPWWPLLVYGPWTVGSLCIIRSALHRRRAVHSWFVVLLFSSIAVSLSVAQADKTLTGIAGASLPALSSLACFHQLVRQITLTMPPQQSARRHRQAESSRT